MDSRSGNPSPTTRFRRLAEAVVAPAYRTGLLRGHGYRRASVSTPGRISGKYGVASAGLRLASAHDRLTVGIDASNWMGEDSFGLVAASVRLRSRDDHRGRVFIVRGGGAVATESTPADLWFAGDTGNVRSSLLRAHPIVTDGMLESDRLGRRIAHVSGEVRQWRTVRSISFRSGVPPSLPLGEMSSAVSAALDSRSYVDVGAGLRLALPFLPWRLQASTLGKYFALADRLLHSTPRNVTLPGTSFANCARHARLGAPVLSPVRHSVLAHRSESLDLVLLFQRMNAPRWRRA